MTLSIGDKIPHATLTQLGDNGPEDIALNDRLKGRKVVIFALPGAYTPTCQSAHVPSYIRTINEFKSKGIDEVICISVNDPFVMKSWGETTGATAAGITMLADASSSFTKSIGMEFSAPAAGLFDRSKRYAMVVEDGIVTQFQAEKARGVCDVSSGEALLAVL